jgi:hypothetical protein
VYWLFAAESQNMFLKKFAGSSFPWSQDPLLNNFKFGNTYRASDEAEQFLIKHVIYKGSQNRNEIFFRILLFRFLNNIEIWQSLEKLVGEISYVGYSNSKTKKAIGNFLLPRQLEQMKLLTRVIEKKIPLKLEKIKRLKEIDFFLRDYLKVSEQLSYYYAVDINYSVLTNISEMDFVKASAGAKAGIKKCFVDHGDYTNEEIIELMCDIQEKECERLGIKFQNLWGRRLHLIDCEMLFREVDKYIRAGSGNNEDLRDLDKFVFTENNFDSDECWFPSKWGIIIR